MPNVPFDHVLDFPYWIYAVSLSSPLTNFITFQTTFLCHKTEYPDELSFQKKTTYQQVNAICNNGIEFDNYNEKYTI